MVLAFDGAPPPGARPPLGGGSVATVFAVAGASCPYAAPAHAQESDAIASAAARRVGLKKTETSAGTGLVSAIEGYTRVGSGSDLRGDIFV